MAVKKMNLPLPPDLHHRLFQEARSEGVPATRLVRSILDRWLADRARAREADELHRFAQEAAGTELDLIPDLEAEAAAELARGHEEGHEER